MDLKDQGLLKRLIERREQLRNVHGRREGGEPADEAEHFYICPVCGQAVDMRELYQVLHHEQAEHAPLPTAS